RSDDIGRPRLAVDCRQLAEITPRVDMGEGDLAPGHGERDDLHPALDHEVDVAVVAVPVEHLLTLAVAPPAAALLQVAQRLRGHSREQFGTVQTVACFFSHLWLPPLAWPQHTAGRAQAKPRLEPQPPNSSWSRS